MKLSPIVVAFIVGVVTGAACAVKHQPLKPGAWFVTAHPSEEDH